MLVSSKTLAHYGAYRVTSNHCIDYGCEAAWAGFYEGVDAIPGALVKYACVDACYHQLCKGAFFCGIEYPVTLKKHALLYTITRAVMPLFIKSCIANVIDIFLNSSCNSDQENDQLLALTFYPS